MHTSKHPITLINTKKSYINYILLSYPAPIKHAHLVSIYPALSLSGFVITTRASYCHPIDNHTPPPIVCINLAPPIGEDGVH